MPVQVLCCLYRRCTNVHTLAFNDVYESCERAVATQTVQVQCYDAWNRSTSWLSSASSTLVVLSRQVVFAGKRPVNVSATATRQSFDSFQRSTVNITAVLSSSPSVVAQRGVRFTANVTRSEMVLIPPPAVDRTASCNGTDLTAAGYRVRCESNGVICAFVSACDAVSNGWQLSSNCVTQPLTTLATGNMGATIQS